MSEDNVYRNTELTEYEWQQVDRVKRTMKVLARVIMHRELDRVKQDIDPRGEMNEAELERLARQHLTPDLPGLYGDEETVMLGQLSSAIFAALAAEDHEEADD
jgi:hypothetical protein